MRPVNLIPADDRRDGRGPLRTGAVPYLIVGVLAAALLGVTLVVTTNSKIADRQAEKVSLEAQVSQAQTEAARLRSFTDFASMQNARQETVSSLATSRFDWERVLRGLAIVLPEDVWLTSLDASASPDASATSSDSTTSSSAGEGIEGPSLDIHGCASGHDAVARFLAALRDVDGVTRVAVMSSDRPEESSASSGAATSSAGATGTSCATRDFISTFEVVAAFDNAVPTAAAVPPTAALAAPTATTTTPSDADQSAVSDGQQQLQQQEDSAAGQTERGKKAVGTFIPGTGSTP